LKALSESALNFASNVSRHVSAQALLRAFIWVIMPFTSHAPSKLADDYKLRKVISYLRRHSIASWVQLRKKRNNFLCKFILLEFKKSLLIIYASLSKIFYSVGLCSDFTGATYNMQIIHTYINSVFYIGNYADSEWLVPRPTI